MKFHAVINTHCLVNGGMNVGGRTGIGSGFGSLGIARTINLSAPNPSAGKNQGINTGVMIPSSVAIDLRGTPEISQEDDKGFVKHAAHFQIGQECGSRTVENGKETVFHLREMITMGIPIVSPSAGQVTG